jgi:rhodanese-related sulfurtransferase
MKRNPFIQALVLIVAAAVIAVVSNAFAARTRRVVLPGYYPHALRVPPKEPVRVPPPPVTETMAPVTVSSGAAAASAAEAPRPATDSAGTPPGTGTAAGAALSPQVPKPVPASAAPVTPAKPAVDLSKFQPHPDKASVDISGEEALALHAAGALFLDARRTSVYEAGHIAGARSFSVWEADVDQKVNALFDERGDPADQNKPIVIYCSGGACEDSHMLAEKLWGIQFNNLYVYKDGFPDWQKRGGAVKTGGAP